MQIQKHARCLSLREPQRCGCCSSRANLAFASVPNRKIDPARMRRRLESPTTTLDGQAPDSSVIRRYGGSDICI